MEIALRTRITNPSDVRYRSLPLCCYALTPLVLLPRFSFKSVGRLNLTVTYEG